MGWAVGCARRVGSAVFAVSEAPYTDQLVGRYKHALSESDVSCALRSGLITSSYDAFDQPPNRRANVPLPAGRERVASLRREAEPTSVGGASKAIGSREAYFLEVASVDKGLEVLGQACSSGRGFNQDADLDVSIHGGLGEISG